MNPDKFFEDLAPGDTFHTAAITVSEAEILEFAGIYDPQPMHIDRDYAERGPFKGLIASGWHTAALVMKLTAEAKPFGNTPVLGLGVERMEWPQPVRPGDTIRVESRVEEKRVSKSKPDFGIIKFRSTAYNQHDEPVFVVVPSCWVPRRPA